MILLMILGLYFSIRATKRDHHLKISRARVCLCIWISVSVCVCVCVCVCMCVLVNPPLFGQKHCFSPTLSGHTPLSGRPGNGADSIFVFSAVSLPRKSNFLMNPFCPTNGVFWRYHTQLNTSRECMAAKYCVRIAAVESWYVCVVKIYVCVARSQRESIICCVHLTVKVYTRVCIQIRSSIDAAMADEARDDMMSFEKTHLYTCLLKPLE